MASKYNIKNINRRIKNIKDRDLPLITLKGAAQGYRELFYKSGTYKEGEIVPYKVAEEQYLELKNDNPNIEDYSYDLYIERLKTFIDAQEKALNVRDVTLYSYNLGIKRLEGSNAYEKLADFNISENDIKSLSRAQFIDMMRSAGYKANEDEKLGYGSDQFYEYIVQWWEENKGIEDY